MTKRHQPLHLYLDSQLYFLSVHLSQQIMKDNSRKMELRTLLTENLARFKYELLAWVILDDHYHVDFKTLLGKDLSTILKLTHGSLSFKWNKEDSQQGRTLFQNYWDRCIRNESDLWSHINYTHNNPIKHGYVKSLENLAGYPFSSYPEYLKRYGTEGMQEIWRKYPVIDYIKD